MPCPFGVHPQRGRHASELTRVLIDSHGNQCALITTAYAPCRMEISGDTPDLQRCELAGSARAIDFASFDTIGNGTYPD